MQLSIIIVNFNVKHFLEQCLYAVLKAVKGIEAEVIVVDNASADGSVAYLQPLFPRIQFIANTENLGFAKANNRALARCQGEYVLFLNPDTLIPEDSLGLCLAFMKDHPQAGALGVRMLDGKGRFLAESKRSVPSPLVSFYKLVGLAALLPRSRIFNKYALGNLDEGRNHQVDVLPGAFMLASKQLLDTLNGFDESYFMYGEDIDLSFRIQQTGRQNYYFAGTSIIHFKGESSRKKSLGYVKLFYRAMLVFVQRHYQRGPAKWFSYFIRLAITFRAIIAALYRIINPIVLPLADGVLVWLSLKMVSVIWASQLRDGKDFGVPFMVYALPLFSLIYVASAALIGLYDRPYKTSRIILSAVAGSVSILAAYSLLPETLRFSRGVILWGGVLGSLLILLLRQLLGRWKKSPFAFDGDADGQTVVVATEKEYAEIRNLLENATPGKRLLGRIAPDKEQGNTLCGLQDLVILEKKIPLREIIFCEGSLSLKEIISQVQLFASRDTQILFHMHGSHSMVGSDMQGAVSKIVTRFSGYRIGQPHQKRMKRMVDLVLALLFLLASPIHLIVHSRGGRALVHHAFDVLRGHKTWVGYACGSALLPDIKKGVITHMGTTPSFSVALLEKADKLYAKNYDWWQDAVIIFQHYKQLA